MLSTLCSWGTAGYYSERTFGSFSAQSSMQRLRASAHDPVMTDKSSSLKMVIGGHQRSSIHCRRRSCNGQQIHWLTILWYMFGVVIHPIATTLLLMGLDQEPNAHIPRSKPKIYYRKATLPDTFSVGRGNPNLHGPTTPNFPSSQTLPFMEITQHLCGMACRCIAPGIVCPWYNDIIFSSIS